MDPNSSISLASFSEREWGLMICCVREVYGEGEGRGCGRVRPALPRSWWWLHKALWAGDCQALRQAGNREQSERSQSVRDSPTSPHCPVEGPANFITLPSPALPSTTATPLHNRENPNPHSDGRLNNDVRPRLRTFCSTGSIFLHILVNYKL